MNPSKTRRSGMVCGAFAHPRPGIWSNRKGPPYDLPGRPVGSQSNRKGPPYDLPGRPCGMQRKRPGPSLVWTGAFLRWRRTARAHKTARRGWRSWNALVGPIRAGPPSKRMRIYDWDRGRVKGLEQLFSLAGSPDGPPATPPAWVADYPKAKWVRGCPPPPPPRGWGVDHVDPPTSGRQGNQVGEEEEMHGVFRPSRFDIN